MGRTILVCPFGQRAGSVDPFDASVTTYKNTDVDRFNVFTYPSQDPAVFPDPGGNGQGFRQFSKMFIRRFRVFSSLMSQGVKIYNKGFNGSPADAFEFRLKFFSVPNPASTFEDIFFTRFCPALNEWVDINSLYGPSPFILNDKYGLGITYTTSVDTRKIPADILSQSLPNDLRFELELDH